MFLRFLLCFPPQICEAFAANRYPFPEDPSRQRQMHGDVTTRLRELRTTIDAGQRHREGVLQNIAFNLEQWVTQVRRCVVGQSWARVVRWGKTRVECFCVLMCAGGGLACLQVHSSSVAASLCCLCCHLIA